MVVPLLLSYLQHFLFIYLIKDEASTSDPEDSNHSIHMLLQQKTLQLELLQLEVNGMRANLMLTEYLVKIMEIKHEILVRRRQVFIFF